MTDPEQDRPEAELPAPAAPQAGMRPGPRSAPESDVKAYIAPIDLPTNNDDARATREFSRIQISPELDSRRRPTVRRVMPRPGEVVPEANPPLEAVSEETASLGTNLGALAAAKAASTDPRLAEIKQATIRMQTGAPVASPSPTLAPIEIIEEPGERSAGPRGTVMMKQRARGGTRMMIAGVPESATLPARAGSDSGDGAKGSSTLRGVVLGAVVVLGLVTLGLFASRGIASNPAPGDATNHAANAAAAAVATAALAPTQQAEPSEVDPPASAAVDDHVTDAEQPSGEARTRSRHARPKPSKRAPASTSATAGAPKPMFERSEGK